MEIINFTDIESLRKRLYRKLVDDDDLYLSVGNILNNVKNKGDISLRDYSKMFDKVVLDNIIVTEDELSEAGNFVSDDLKNAISLAIENVSKFHVNQKNKDVPIETMGGIVCWRKQLPIEKIGLYIPGGSAPLFSTVIMLAIPAKIAGCEEIILCTPLGKDGNVNPVILYTAKLCGVSKVYKIGGAQAIAAMAYGTETVPKVYKIFGPGNKYVTIAKQIVSMKGIAIDMPAGPSELAVLADDSANASFVAADLLSQAEHDPDSQVLLVTCCRKLVKDTIFELKKQVENLSRKEIAKKAIDNSKIIIAENYNQAIEIINDYAPEHLIIAMNDSSVKDMITNAGSVFIGNYATESIGDYASGTNHTLPTNGAAKAYSGLTLEAFCKYISFQTINEQGIRNIGPYVEKMAEAEGLDAHKNAVTIRLKFLQNENRKTY
ncbi:MAG: histidinol dehydrogenase [Bacteroidetes bacterium GWE2_29_8]|nr:MAG: histidinol dehydrogenase [Bacteroidetes bacterium GWE2_29_8]OFY23963.1 MAG: histidinol dehydrogenase [Bacteroidetes bacterium GWF2_29_10]